MKKLDKDTKFAHLGKPGSAFSKGFERRLKLLEQVVDLNDKKILDQGCGMGVWLDQFLNYTDPKNVYGFDVDQELIKNYKLRIKNSNSRINPENIKVCFAEDLDFPDNFFDIVFSNEVMEHVEDDKKTMVEALRVLKPGGKFIIFTPNRGWPFETHGAFFRGKYYWGNIPLLPWLPKSFQKKFAHHVRNYWNKDIKKLVEGTNGEIIYHNHVFPGFDGAVRRFGIFGKLLQKFFHTIEKTPLHYFGISHFVVVEKR